MAILLKYRWLIVGLVVLGLALPASAQSTIEELNAEIRRAEQEIAEGEELLSKINQDQSVNSQQIKLLQELKELMEVIDKQEVEVLDHLVLAMVHQYHIQEQEQQEHHILEVQEVGDVTIIVMAQFISLRTQGGCCGVCRRC